MRRFPMLASLLALTVVSAFSQLPPIIDRELFFGDPEISGAQISPDGKYIAFLKPFMNVRNIWVKERSEPFEKARPITADTNRPIGTFFWSRDSRIILYDQDKGGDENYRIYAVDPRADGTPVPPSRDLTPMEKVRAEIIDVPKRTPNTIVIGLNDRRADLHDVYRLDLTTGERTLLRKNDQNVVGWQMDLQGNLRLGLRLTPDGGTEILRVDPDTLISIYSVSPEETCSPVRFTPDGTKFYLITNKSRDKVELELFDPATGKSSVVDRDPKNEVDLSDVIFSDITNELQATIYVGDRVRVYPKQKQFASDWARLTKSVPPGELGYSSVTADENLWVVTVSSDVDPGSRYLFDRTTGTSELLYRSRPNLPSDQLSSMKPVMYKARDGMNVHAYLVTPKGVPAKNLPTIMLVHGGPWARNFWGYSSEAQFFANRGYAVLMPNFRGSTGYGKKYLNAGNKQWGTGAMQHDISDGVKYIERTGVADPKRVGIYGGSYGGYATLAGLAFTPNLYAAGISYVGPSNIITLLKSIPAYWAPMKKVFAIRVGDMDKPKEREMLERQSPLNSADKIKAPLLVIQGANDPRVNKGESDRIVIAVRDLGHPVEYLVAPDEGHGFAGKLNRLAAYTAMEKFFGKYLGGRCQESMTPEIGKKLASLTVDVKTVTAQTTTSSDESVAVPPVFDPSLVKADSVAYTIKYTMNGQEISMAVARIVAIVQSGPAKIWRVIDNAHSPMGDASDTVEIDAGTLRATRQSATQGPMIMKYTFTPDSINGIVSAGPNSMPVKLKVTTLTLPDGAGLELPIATLPLKEGYRTSLDVFTPMLGKSTTMTVRVGGIEKVTVPAGTFDAYPVSVVSRTDEDGYQKYWFAKDSRKLVKSEAKLPATMGGGSVAVVMVK